MKSSMDESTKIKKQDKNYPISIPILQLSPKKIKGT
jgi:hypothetical protein